MSKTAKEIVKGFYNSDILKDTKVISKYFHQDVVLIWNSSDGLSILHFQELENFFSEIRRTYHDLRVEISHVLEDDNFITIRYKYYIRTLENPDEELGIAHFIGIWEVKDKKMYRGYMVSQPVTDQDDTNESYHKVKV